MVSLVYGLVVIGETRAKTPQRDKEKEVAHTPLRHLRLCETYGPAIAHTPPTSAGTRRHRRRVSHRLSGSPKHLNRTIFERIFFSHEREYHTSPHPSLARRAGAARRLRARESAQTSRPSRHRFDPEHSPVCVPNGTGRDEPDWT